MSTTPRTARETLDLARAFLERQEIESARLEAELLVGFALGRSRLELFLDLERPIDETELDRARALLVRRSKGEPTAYLLGRREFYARDFEVGPGVLVPRPESELLVDLGREGMGAVASPRIADLGTGSGCLAVTLALELDIHAEMPVVASDASAAALAFAKRNATRLGAQVRFALGDRLEPLRAHAPFDLLVSNPPYIDPGAAALLPREVREHEPAEALFAPEGSPDHWVELLLDEAGALLTPGGRLLVELGFDQAERLAPRLDAIEGQADTSIRIHSDLDGIQRVLEVRTSKT
jgi:release factor glutamine methyltransferase